MSGRKVGKAIGITSLVLVGINAVIGLLNFKKAKDLEKNYDVAVTFGEEAVDMSEMPPRMSAGAMFSGMTLDYRNCIVLDEPYELELFSRFAGVEIIVPEGWFVEAKGQMMMAGMENYTATYEEEEAKLIIHFKTSFAGLSIKNVSYS